MLNYKSAWVAGPDNERMHRSPAAHVLSVAWHLLTWLRWVTRRGPRCGDMYCYWPEHWPGGKVQYPGR